MTHRNRPSRRAFPLPDGRTALVPSVLSADLSNLGRDLGRVEAAADWIQVDVMDGHFVPNLSFGPGAAGAVAAATRLPVDAHLMVEEPMKFADAFAASGSKLITVHAESRDSLSCLKRIKKLGLAAGVALRPSTPVRAAFPFLKYAHLLLIMTVEPGFGGQQFIPSSPAKIALARKAVRACGRPVWLQVDGGINARTAATAVGAGADSLVMGSAVFGARDPAGFLEGLRSRLESL